MLEIIKNKEKIERIEKNISKTSLDVFESFNGQKHFCYRGFKNNIFFVYYYVDGIMLSGDITEELQKIVDEEEPLTLFEDDKGYV